MTNLYFNDPLGLKEPKLMDVVVNNPDNLLNFSADIICHNLIYCDVSRFFVAPNISSHLAHLLSIIKHKKPEINRVFISDHEIKWIREMLELPDYQPDVTHSNYHPRENIKCPNFSVEILPFDDFQNQIKEAGSASIFYISHVSRLTGQIADIESIWKSIKLSHPESIFIVDGAQSLGALNPINVDTVCDIYLGVSSKFIGAEPHLGFAFISEHFFNDYIIDRNNYYHLNTEDYKKDIYSLSENLKHPLYKSDYYAYIKNLKQYAIEKISLTHKDILFFPPHQAAQFLTINFGSIENNEKFIEVATKEKLILSDNTKWSVSEPLVPLVRIGLSIRITKEDIDTLLKVIKIYFQ